MVAIKLFYAIRTYFEAMGFYAPPQPNQNCELNRRNVFYIFSQVGMVILVMGFFLFKATSAYEYSVCFYLSFAMTNIAFYCVVLIYKFGSIMILIEKNEEFIKNRIEYKPTSTAKYMELNEKIELLSKWGHIIMAELTLAGVVLPLLLLSIVNYFFFDLGDESFILPWPMLLPFKWKTPIGYSIAIVAEGASAHGALFCTTPIVSFFVASACLIIYSLEDISNDSAELVGNEKSNKNHIKIKERFCHLIRFYSDAKQFIVEFNEIYEFIIATLFLFSLCSLAASLLVFLSQSSQRNSNPVEMIFTLIMICTALVPLLFYCELGEMIGQKLNKFDEELYQCDWHAFPLEMQKLLLTFMSSTQRSMVFQGYANTVCTRDAFKTIVKGGFSYFMALERIAE